MSHLTADSIIGMSHLTADSTIGMSHLTADSIIGMRVKQHAALLGALSSLACVPRINSDVPHA